MTERKTYMEVEEASVDKITELKEITKPLIDFLHKYYDPHTSIVVTQTNVEVLYERKGSYPDIQLIHLTWLQSR